MDDGINGKKTIDKERKTRDRSVSAKQEEVDQVLLESPLKLLTSKIILEPLNDRFD